MIRHLRQGDIDKTWWDAQLLRCTNRLWYAQSWVLDIMSPGWEALVDDSTGAIMPLTWRRKYGIHYLFTPYALQQLGVFAPAMDLGKGLRMLDAVPLHFRYWDLWLNSGMRIPAGIRGRVIEQTDQVIHLRSTIDILRASYSEGHRRNLRKAMVDPLEQREVPVELFVELFTRTTGSRFGNVPKGADVLLQRMIEAALERDQCHISGAWLGSEAIAAVCFITWEERTIMLKSANDERGQDRRAMFQLVDAEIARCAGTGKLFDFAGSNTPSVARFNAGFGATSTVYLRLVRNLLPAPLRWLKR